MTARWISTFQRCCLALGMVLLPGMAVAQISTDGSLGAAEQLNGPNFTIPAGLGQQAGNNLFHSFGQFNLQDGQSATFQGPASIANIVSRVTGGQPSSIDGALVSDIPGADFFFINPAGIVFGPNASVAVGGALHLSTASSVRMADGQVFRADSATGGGLSVAPVSAFGFDSADASAIVINGTGSIVNGASTTGIHAANGESLTLSAGAIALDPGVQVQDGVGHATLTTLGGSITLSAVGEPAELPVVPAPGGGVAGGPVVLGGAAVIVGVDSAGIVINGSQVDLTGEAQVQSIGANNTAGPIQVTANTITVQDGASILSNSFGPGGSADIRLTASDLILLRLSGETNISGTGTQGITNFAAETNTGQTGGITLQAARIAVDGAFNVLDTASAGATASGAIRLEAGDSIRLNNLLLNSGSVSGAADAGNITVLSPLLTLGNVVFFAGSSTTTNSNGAGRAGRVEIQAGDAQLSGVQIDVSSGSLGNAGELILAAGTAQITSTQIDASASQAGSPGSIQIEAGERIGMVDSFLLASADGTVTQSASPRSVLVRAPLVELVTSGIFAGASGQATSGQVAVSGEQVTLTGAAVTGESRGNQPGATVSVTGSRAVVLDGSVVSTLARSNGAGGDIRITGGEIRMTGANLEGGTNGAGDSGAVIVQGSSLTLADRSGIVSASQSPVVDGQIDFSQIPAGNAGEIRIEMTGNVLLAGQSLVSSATSGTGVGANIIINASQLRLDSGSSVSADSFSSSVGADAGAISVTLTDSMTLVGASSLSTQTRASNGGAIVLMLPNRLLIRDASITTSVAGSGNGGNITIDPDFIVLDNGRILASALNGDGGNIRLVINDGGALVVSPESVVNASSSFGVDGQIEVTAPERDISGALRALDAQPIDPDALTRQPCAPASGKRGRLLVQADRRADAFSGELMDADGRAAQVSRRMVDPRRPSQRVGC